MTNQAKKLVPDVQPIQPDQAGNVVAFPTTVVVSLEGNDNAKPKRVVSRGNAWVAFLTAVLNHAERGDITEGEARKLWRRCHKVHEPSLSHLAVENNCQTHRDSLSKPPEIERQRQASRRRRRDQTQVPGSARAPCGESRR